ncbi:HAMP domain-containing histidine kinase [Acaricomes phytoseiuli]|nr:HAMP domain-containing histidine kinase [Acaricomes phytoseiuli]MCW1249504.1 HAMP domain-containing histidine kinase [Acaricomes phytoseiuli]
MLQSWRRASLRTQLVAMIGALLAFSLLVLGTAASVLLRSFQEEQLDSQLRIVESTIRSSGFSIGTGDGTIYARLSAQDGSVLQERRATAGSPDFPAITLEEAKQSNGVPFDLPSANGSNAWRGMLVAPLQFQVPGSPGQGQSGYILIAISYAEFAPSTSRLTAVMLAVSILTVSIGTLIAYLTVSRSFQPLNRVERTAAAIADGDLSQRVAVQNPATEVGKLSVSLNTMLAHIERAFEARTRSESQMRRFIANASHELRTPLVTIRGFSELYRHGALQDEEDISTAMGRIESEAKRMGVLVSDLLVLARIDERRPMEAQPVNLLVIGNDAAVDARASAPGREITVVGLGGEAPSNAPAVGDDSRLRQVVSNLMANALRYTPQGTPIEVAVGVERRADGSVDASVLEIRDHGQGVPQEERSRIFERFYRSDSSRNRDTGGSGLGLAIVSAIVTNHRGTVQISDTPGGGATMTVRLPYAPETLETGPLDITTAE